MLEILEEIPPAPPSGRRFAPPIRERGSRGLRVLQWQQRRASLSRFTQPVGELVRRSQDRVDEVHESGKRFAGRG